MKYPYEGLHPEMLQFLVENRKRNSKPWFEAHRDEYEAKVLNPLRGLVEAMAQDMLAVDSMLEVRPQVGKTISRIFRDTRFSRDKSLFREVMWITFKRPVQPWLDIPGWFFEVRPDGYRYGMGFYTASPEFMRGFREMIEEKPDSFLKRVSGLDNTVFSMEGETYKRPPKISPDPEIQAWLERKSFYLVCNRDPDDLLFSPDLAGTLVRDFQSVAPFYRFLADLRFEG